jgi:hypothetical protein
MEKRREPRTALHHFSFDASDGSRFYQGAIFDVSRNGICMTNLPRMAGGATRMMWVIVAGPKHRFKMQVRPKWTIDKGCGKTIGAEIVSPPPGWAEFIIGFEPKNDSEAVNFIHR